MNLILSFLVGHWRQIALAAALALAAGWCYQSGLRAGKAAVMADWNAERLAASEARLALEKEARAQEQAWQDKVREANDARQKLETQMRGIRADTGRELDGLRGELARYRAGLPEDSGAAVSGRAAACFTVFGECAQRYSEMAESADECAADRQALIEGWPK